jgi:hypothetical protein
MVVLEAEGPKLGCSNRRVRFLFSQLPQGPLVRRREEPDDADPLDRQTEIL